ncbi:Zn-dependent M28 family amino/carboxypeptidase [Subtercola boreus]|nr:Zn-dependent M28 family amino/carboxypeptidase [Subtercola boreus]
MHRTLRNVIASSIGVGVLVVGAGAFGSSAAAAVDPVDLKNRVTVDGIMTHLAALQAIADENDGNRAIGTPGYEASAEYIEGVLAAAGYETTRQPFQTSVQTIFDYSLAVTADGDALPVVGIPMEFTGSTPAEGLTDLPAIAPAAVNGCSADDWAGIDASGSVAIVSRGVCPFADKAIAAGAAGASAILIYNNTEGDLSGTLGATTVGAVPSVGVTAAEGASILTALAAGPVTVSLQLDQETKTVDTFNVLAETSTGRDDNTVMVGAHLDSVPAGPGINDNGSGSATILETAVQLAASGPLNNQVRFAWWGAEEVGLVGSTFYVDDLVENNPDELDEIATYLNFDMVASPNYVISVYDADQSTFEAPVEVPEGSIATEAAFTDYFDASSQPWIDTAFDGRSDYEAFIANDIPASGLFTGADEIKTPEQVALFGGIAGEAQDQNYHQAGDNLENINTEALGIMAGAIGSVVGSLANDTSAINGVVPPVEPTPVPTPTPTSTPVPTGAPVPTASPTAVPAPTSSATAAPVPPADPGSGSGGSLANTGSADVIAAALPFGVLLFSVGLAVALLASRRRARPTGGSGD